LRKIKSIQSVIRPEKKQGGKTVKIPDNRDAPQPMKAAHHLPGKLTMAVPTVCLARSSGNKGKARIFARGFPYFVLRWPMQ
jgi:hypothetical protein